MARETMTVWMDKQEPPELSCPGPVPIVTLLAQRLSRGFYLCGAWTERSWTLGNPPGMAQGQFDSDPPERQSPKLLFPR